jgi:hypothetical protein
MNTQARIDKLNEIQSEWMALSNDASEKEKKRVFSLMEKLPKSYLSISEDMAIVMFDGQPITRPMKIATALEYHGGIIPEKDIAWDNGKWIKL